MLPATGLATDLGLNYPDDRFYHRGHTWVKPAEDGTFTIGLDELADHLIGNPDSIKMPEVGTELEINQTAWRMSKNGNEIQVRAPIEGTSCRRWRAERRLVPEDSTAARSTRSD